MWEEYGRLRPRGRAAEILAQHEWPALYNADRLRHNDVPVAATIYVDDLYVEREFAMETARLIKGLRAWITNEYEHNGLRRRGAGAGPPHRHGQGPRVATSTAPPTGWQWLLAP